MIKGVKELMKSKETADTILSEMKEQKKEVTSLRKEISLLKADLLELKKSSHETDKRHEEMAEKLESELASFSELRAKLGKEIKELSIDKSRMTDKVINNVRDDVSRFTSVLDTDLEKFNRLKDQLSDVKSSIKDAESELKRFRDIPSKIKTADFDLTKHAAKLKTMHDEKISLVRKIDSLERLVARLRRR